MTVYKDTGHDSTLTLSGGFTAKWRKIGAVEQELEKVEDTVLDSTSKEYLPGDVAEPGEFEVEAAFSMGQALPALGSVQTITITAPLKTGQATAANLAGTGFLRKRTAMPELATNTLQVEKLTIAFDGKTGPAFTPAVDA